MYIQNICIYTVCSKDRGSSFKSVTVQNSGGASMSTAAAISVSGIVHYWGVDGAHCQGRICFLVCWWWI